MSINDIPEDLFDYFPLELGATCKRFNKKINIYNRTIIVLGDITEKSINYAKLKRIDTTKLPTYGVKILLSQANPETLYIHNLYEYLTTPGKKLKHLYIKSLTLDRKNMKTISSMIKNNCRIYIDHLHMGFVRLDKKYADSVEIDKVYIHRLEELNDIQGFNVKNVILDIVPPKPGTAVLAINGISETVVTIKTLPLFKEISKYIENIKHKIIVVDWKEKTRRYIKESGLQKYIDSGKIKIIDVIQNSQNKTDKIEKEDPDEYISDSD